MKKLSNTIVLSIVIPAYKEEKRIGKTLDILNSYLKKADFLKEKQIEIIVVAADAEDKTKQIVEAKESLFTNFQLLLPGPKSGKGRDVQYGMLRAKGKAVLFMDADLATPLKYLKIFYENYCSGNEVVVGVRDLRRYRRNPQRITVSAIGNILYRIAGGVWIEDSQCGFKLFSSKATKTCFTNLQIMGWGFDMEVLAAAKANNYKVKTIHIPEWEAKEGGTFEDDILMNTLRSFTDLSLILLKRITGSYKLKDM